MKILITGAKGQVGTDLVLEAKKRGHEAYGFTSSEIDITDKDIVTNTIASIKPNVVINAAAYTAVDKAEQDIDKAYAVNETGVKNLAEACEALDIPLLHISTDYVFDGNKKEPYTEADTPSPTGVYGASKLAGEIALQKTWNKHVILRVSWVFGEHGNNFVRTMLRLANDRDELSVVNDQYGAPTSAKAIAECLLDIAEKSDFGKKEFPWGLYHFQSDPGVTWYEFAKEIFSLAKESGILDKEMHVHSINSDQFPTPVKRPLNSKLNGNKALEGLSISHSKWKSGYLQSCMVKVR
jgi:dTDP-4-dehydrorhamnose reductase